MSTNKENKIQNYSQVLADEFGEIGSLERKVSEEKAFEFYTSMLLHQARKEARITQQELAKRTDTTKSYISRIENGHLQPSAALFFRLIAALGMKIEIAKPII